MKMSELENFAKHLDHYGWEVEHSGGTVIRLRGAGDRGCYTLTLDTDSEGGADYVGVTILHDRYGECAFRNWPLETAMGSWINGVIDGYRTGGQAGYTLGFHAGQALRQKDGREEVEVTASN